LALLPQVALSQHQYIIDMLDTYGFADCSPVQTPMVPNTHLSASDCLTISKKHKYMQQFPYINAVGALMYLATSTRSDIAYTVSKLACFSSNPGKIHWTAVKHPFRYLKGTMDLKLTYGPDSSKPELFSIYSDADFGMDPDICHSTGGCLVSMETRAVNWSSKLQSQVTLSTTEAECVAAVDAGKKAVWMHNLLSELGYKFDSLSVFHIDNNSAIVVAKNPEKFSCVKHIDLLLY
jgi:hypothetical protein